MGPPNMVSSMHILRTKCQVYGCESSMFVFLLIVLFTLVDSMRRIAFTGMGKLTCLECKALYTIVGILFHGTDVVLCKVLCVHVRSDLMFSVIKEKPPKGYLNLIHRRISTWII